MNLIHTVLNLFRFAFYLVFFIWAAASAALLVISMILPTMAAALMAPFRLIAWMLNHGKRQDARRLKAAAEAYDQLQLDKAVALTKKTEQAIVDAILEVA